jgi:hypothetical protein
MEIKDIDSLFNVFRSIIKDELKAVKEEIKIQANEIKIQANEIKIQSNEIKKLDEKLHGINGRLTPIGSSSKFFILFIFLLIF